MTTTDTDALKERIALAIYGAQVHAFFPDDLGDAPKLLRESVLTQAAAVLPIVAVEVRKAKAEAWDEGAQAQADTYGGQIDTGPNPYRETGDSDERR